MQDKGERNLTKKAYQCCLIAFPSIDSKELPYYLDLGFSFEISKKSGDQNVLRKGPAAC